MCSGFNKQEGGRTGEGDTLCEHPVFMAGPAHVSRVRFLYKRLLVLHRFLPIDLRALGDQYVKDEFRRHKSASPENVTSFMAEWEHRCIASALCSFCVSAITLTPTHLRGLTWVHVPMMSLFATLPPVPKIILRDGTMGQSRCYHPLRGDELRETLQTQVLQAAGGQLSSEDNLGNFQSDQIGQLYELMLESTKSSRQFDIQEDGKCCSEPPSPRSAPLMQRLFGLIICREPQEQRESLCAKECCGQEGSD
ncbi:hypothetical protein NQZ68_007332 [Dissostichus eleginoides]|nr:hypothetical protein NQZ68_007332 [Dissostichus eleginoides]